MDANNYYFYLNQFKEKILALPVSEAKYDLYLLWLGLHNASTPYTHNILDKAIRFIDTFHQFHTNIEQHEAISLLGDLGSALQELITSAETNTTGAQIQHHALNITGIFTGIGGGICGANLGVFAGISRGLWNQSSYPDFSLRGVAADLALGGAILSLTGMLAGMGTGYCAGILGAFAGINRVLSNGNNYPDFALRGAATGFALGAAIGNRSPHLLSDPLFRQLKFAMDGLRGSFTRAFAMVRKVQDHYFNAACQWLLHDYFDDNADEFHTFIAAETVNYDIVSRPAEFGSETLRGYVGQHFMIKMLINKRYLLLEFTPGPSDPTLTEIQTETRTINSAKLLEMLAWHLALQETDAFSAYYAVTELAPGITDCASYVNKLLIGTSQEPAKFGRFHPSDNVIGYNIVGTIMTSLSPNPQVLTVEEPEEVSFETAPGF